MPADETDRLILDLARIARVARRDAETNERYRVYLKREMPLSNDALDAVVAGIRDAVVPQIDCVACNRCCRTLQIVLDRKDIARLARRRGTTPDAFARAHVATAPDGVQHFAASPCPMLGDDGRCTVYEDRPRACRDYPYLDTPKFRSRSLTMVENVGACPIVFNVWERLKKRVPLPPERA